jgi:hypothetical protein
MCKTANIKVDVALHHEVTAWVIVDVSAEALFEEAEAERIAEENSDA